jgi:mycothiol synthase
MSHYSSPALSEKPGGSAAPRGLIIRRPRANDESAAVRTSLLPGERRESGDLVLAGYSGAWRSLVAVNGKEVLAEAVWRPLLERRHQLDTLVELRVHPKARRQGIGTRLVRCLAQLCRAQGGRQLIAQLEASDASPGSLAFLNSLGFSSPVRLLTFELRGDLLSAGWTAEAAAVEEVVWRRGDDVTEAVLRQLPCDAFRDPFALLSPGTTPGSALAGFELEAASGGRAFLARRGSHAIGCALLLEAHPWYPPEIAFLAVHPEYRGQGVTRQLLTKCAAAAREGPHHRLRLQVSEGMPDLQQLGLDLGFHPLNGLLESTLPLQAAGKAGWAAPPTR